METEWERRSQLGLLKLAEFIDLFSGSGKFTSTMYCSSQLYPYITDLFLLENPKSNSQVTMRTQRTAIFTRALVQQSILNLNEKYFGKATSLN